MYESRRQKPLTRAHFARRLLLHAAAVIALFVASIAIGMIGYVSLERLSWLDAFLETCMLLGGMGPIHEPQTEGGKLFAGFFALYGGLAFIVAAAVLLSPVLHRVMHHLHWDESSRGRD